MNQKVTEILVNSLRTDVDRLKREMLNFELRFAELQAVVYSMAKVIKEASEEDESGEADPAQETG